MQKHFRGDIGLFRAALKRAGFVADGMMFNDDSKANPKKPTRRLKMWFADTVFEAPQYRLVSTIGQAPLQGINAFPHLLGSLLNVVADDKVYVDLRRPFSGGGRDGVYPVDGGE